LELEGLQREEKICFEFLVSPTGGLIVSLSASRFAMMTAATAPREYFLHVVSKNKPDLSVQGHRYMKIGKEHTHS
jgi:hypothetical protein